MRIELPGLASLRYGVGARARAAAAARAFALAPTEALALSLGHAYRPRPVGPVMWVHLSPGADPAGAIALMQALAVDRGDVEFVVTPEAAAWPGALPAPIDTGAVAARFLDHWRPDLILWVGAEPRPIVLAAAAGRGIPFAFVDVTLPNRGPTPMLSALRGAAFVVPADTAVAGRLRQSGAASLSPARLSATPPPPACDAREYDRMRARLATRPAWLADGVGADMLAPVLRAHATASHLSHRLLLILAPDADLDDAAGAARDEGWQVARRAVEGAPADGDQVLVADRPGEAGLWYRLAPLTLLAATFRADGAAGPSPAAPAALGSAILHGAHGKAHAPVLAALDTAGAAEAVADVDDMGAAVERLLAPDRAAAMALAGWRLTTEGAEATDDVRARLNALLDEAAI